MRAPRVAVIGGTGLETLFSEGDKRRVGTPYGPSPTITIRRIGDIETAFLPRHGEGHTTAPHRIDYRANLWALHTLGVERVVSTNAVGGINARYHPGDLIIPDDFVDLTKLRAITFYDEAPVTHIDMTEPYCPELRKILTQAAGGSDRRIWEKGVYACTEGPRFETPAEIRMLRTLGCDIVGMTGFPEVVLARELEICYATVCYVSNMAAGMQSRLTAEEVAEEGRRTLPVLRQVLMEAVMKMPESRSCPCSHSLEGARA